MSASVDYIGPTIDDEHGTSAMDPRWLFLAGVGVRVTPSVAVVAHALVQRSITRFVPDHGLLVGGGLQLAIPRGTVAVRAEHRIDDCDLAEWMPVDARAARCSRVAAEVTQRF